MPSGHLTVDERLVIKQMRDADATQAQIARCLGRHPGTISREIRRNSDDAGLYHEQLAQQYADRRRSQASRRYKLDGTPLGELVRAGLAEDWSPEQIVGRMKREHPDDPSRRISVEAIYQWTYRQHARGQFVGSPLRTGRAR